METKVFFLLFYNNGINCNHWHDDFHHLARRKTKRKNPVQLIGKDFFVVKKKKNQEKKSSATHTKGFFVKRMRQKLLHFEERIFV
jgi:hypothetical protein